MEQAEILLVEAFGHGVAAGQVAQMHYTTWRTTPPDRVEIFTRRKVSLNNKTSYHIFVWSSNSSPVHHVFDYKLEIKCNHILPSRTLRSYVTPMATNPKHGREESNLIPLGNTASSLNDCCTWHFCMKHLRRRTKPPDAVLPASSGVQKSSTFSTPYKGQNTKEKKETADSAYVEQPFCSQFHHLLHRLAATTSSDSFKGGIGRQVYNTTMWMSAWGVK